MKLLLKTVVLGLLMCASCIEAIPNTYLAHAKADASLIQFFLEQGEINQSIDPEITSECFNKYLQLLSQTALNFSTKYEGCITLSDQLTTNLTSQATQNRTEFIEATTKMCQSFQYCGNEIDMVASYNCYSIVAGDFIEPLYAISTSASYAATTLMHGLSKIQENRDLCTTSSEQDYIIETAATYKHLTSCLQNGLPVTENPNISSTSTEGVPATETTITTPVDSILTDNDIQCLPGSGKPIQTSGDDSQTGLGCRSKISGNGHGTGEFKPFPPMKPMPLVETMKQLQSIRLLLQPLKNVVRQAKQVNQVSKPNQQV